MKKIKEWKYLMENSNKNASDLTSNGNSTFLTDEGKKIKDVCVEVKKIDCLNYLIINFYF